MWHMMFWLILSWLIIATVVTLIARSKRRNTMLWWLFALVCWPLALAYALTYRNGD
jgi:hypothetical protein